MSLFKVHLIFGHLEHVLGVTKIHRHRFEYHVGVGRIDLVLFHKDGGVSLVEVKTGYDVHSTVAGIGQLCLYEPAFRRLTIKSAKPCYLNKILVAPMDPERSLPVMAACAVAGVRFVHYAQFVEIAMQREELRKMVSGNGA